MEVGTASQDLLQAVKTEKLRKHDLHASEVALTHKCPVKIISYVMTWDGVVTRSHKRYVKEPGLPPNVEAYTQSLMLKKTLESVALDRRRDATEYGDADEMVPSDDEGARRNTRSAACCHCLVFELEIFNSKKLNY